MATFGKKKLAVAAPNDAYLAAVSRDWPEAASQTFTQYAPVTLTSGYVVECASAITASVPIAGLALEAGGNGATDGLYYTRVVPLLGDAIGFYANLLATGAADYTLLATNLGNVGQLEKGTNYPTTSAGGWFGVITATTPAITVIGFESDMVVPNRTQTIAVAGDVNARVTVLPQAEVLELLL
jgi:hypothetical protein